MKIKSIKKAGPELYRVIYKHWFFGMTERFVIAEDRKEIFTPNYHMFYYRDTGELAHDEDCILSWMIKNKIDDFDNFNYDPIWPRADHFQLPEIVDKTEEIKKDLEKYYTKIGAKLKEFAGIPDNSETKLNRT